MYPPVNKFLLRHKFKENSILQQKPIITVPNEITNWIFKK